MKQSHAYASGLLKRWLTPFYSSDEKMIPVAQNMAVKYNFPIGNVILY